MILSLLISIIFHALILSFLIEEKRYLSNKKIQPVNTITLETVFLKNKKKDQSSKKIKVKRAGLKITNNLSLAIPEKSLPIAEKKDEFKRPEDFVGLIIKYPRRSLQRGEQGDIFIKVIRKKSQLNVYVLNDAGFPYLGEQVKMQVEKYFMDKNVDIEYVILCSFKVLP